MSEQKYTIELTYRQCRVLLSVIANEAVRGVDPYMHAQMNRITKKIYEQLPAEAKS